jgi:hypothetical protein
MTTASAQAAWLSCCFALRQKLNGFKILSEIREFTNGDQAFVYDIQVRG